jgi:nucleotide-binding universal stress UspA family protein
MGADWAAAEVMEENVKEVAAYLAEKERELKSAGLTVSTKALDGGAAGAIIDLVKATPNALVVMTSHGRSGPGRAVLGSVADRVVANANAPVLLLR